MATLSQINIKFFADLKQFSSQMQNSERKIKRFGKSLKKTGKTLTRSVTLPIIAMGVASVKTFADFEQGMAKVKAVSGATGKVFKDLEQNALDLGAKTRYTANEVAALQLSYSKLGFVPAEILKVTNATLDLALATGEDLASSATVAASTLRAFGKDASQMQSVVDVMANSFSSSALDLEKFKTGMSTVAPVAKNANVSLEETTAFLSILVDRGIDASTAGTGLRNMFLELAKQGITLDVALARINNSTNKNATALKLFGKRGATVASIMAENISEAKDLTTAYQNSGGAAKRMAKIMDNTLQGSLFKLKSAVESLFISIGDNLKPIVEGFAKRIASLVSSFKNLDEGTKSLVVRVGLLAAAIGPLLTVMGYMATNVVPGLIKIFGVLRAAMIALGKAALANPWIALATGIALVVSAILLYNNSTDEAIRKTHTLNSVRETAVRSIAAEKAKLAELLSIAKDENLSKGIRLKAIKELNRISPKYLGKLNLETINTDLAREAVEKYTNALIASAKAKAAAAALEEIQSKIIEEELSFHKEKENILNKMLSTGIQTNATDARGAELIQQQGDLLKQKELLSKNNLANLNKEAELLVDIIKKNQTNAQVIAGTKPPVIPTGSAQQPTAQVLQTPEMAGLADIEIKSPLEGMGDKTAEELAKTTEATSAYIANMERMREMGVAIGGSVADAFSSMSDSIVDSLGLANTGFQGFIKGLAKTITKLIAMMLSSSISQSIAGATASGTATGPAAVFSTPAFIATAVGGVMSAFASIPSFSTGGMMGGTSFFGDKLLARINSGEMILNQKQQYNLAGMLQPVSAAPQQMQLSGEFRISGNDLALSLNRTNNRNNRLV